MEPKPYSVGRARKEHLVRALTAVPGVSGCARDDAEGRPDVSLVYAGVPLAVECKNVLRDRSAAGLARLDFQRTRGSKNDPCSRFYSPQDFDVVAACLHAVEREWVFSYALPGRLDPHKKCPGKISNAVRVDERWNVDAATVLASAAHAKN